MLWRAPKCWVCVLSWRGSCVPLSQKVLGLVRFLRGPAEVWSSLGEDGLLDGFVGPCGRLGGMEVGGCISRTRVLQAPWEVRTPGVSQVPVGQLVLVPGVLEWNVQVVYGSWAAERGEGCVCNIPYGISL